MLGMAIAYTFAETLTKSGETPSRSALISTLEGGRVTGAGMFPLTLSERNHTAYNGAQLSNIDSGTQSYLGTPFLAGAGGALVSYVGDPVPVPDATGIPVR
jgi:branched-chain amino acid transport system substrate-binding protein